MFLKLLNTAFRRLKPSAAELEALALRHYERGELDLAEQYFRELALRNASEPEAWQNFSALLMKRKRYAAALPVLTRLLELQPDLAEAHLDLGTCHHRLADDRNAILHFEQAVALKPGLHAAHAGLLDAYMSACDWARVERWCADFLEFRETHPPDEWSQRAHPLSALIVFPSSLTKEIVIHHARDMAKAVLPSAPAPMQPSGRHDGKIRLGYVSSDFNNHAMGHLTFGLYEAHDRAMFEVFAYSTGPSDESINQKHIRSTCDHFTDVHAADTTQISARIRADGIDILVNMNGYTSGNRRDVFAQRPAPVQVSYIGFPGTSGADYIDYFITDKVATPSGFEHEFTEQLVFLPDSYFANHRQARTSDENLPRAALGLPAEGVVFCCFNALRKVNRPVFDSWMAILRAVPKSVLWLVKGGELTEINLCAEARTRGVDSARLVFAAQVEKSIYLARHRHADLFLDTYAYNAHTTACDSLWAGVPVLTLPGDTFARRVGASLLRACDMPELVVDTREEYVAMAVKLANERETLASLKAKLAESRMSCALFDIQRYVKHFETAFRKMHDIRLSGRSPHSFSVSP